MSHFYVGYYATVLVHIKFFFVREGAIFWQKYQNLYKRILSTFSSNIFIFMNKGLQVVQQIYFCILYSIKKRDYSCYPFIGDIIWHRHHDINLPEKPVIFHSSKNGFFSIFIEVLGYLDYCEKRGYSPKILLDTGYYLET
jgi:hypothetical protein